MNRPEFAMRRSNLLLPLCLVAVTLAGCGQKGPLIMPPKPTPTATTTAKHAAPAHAATAAAMAAPTTAPTTPTNTNIPDGQTY